MSERSEARRRQVDGAGGVALCALATVVGLAGATVAAAATPRFSDVSAAAGIDLTIETFGAVVTDLDNDGDDDLVVSCHGSGPQVFANRGDGTFANVTAVLPATRGDRHGITVVDFDRDGDRDLLMAGGGADGVGVGRGAVAMSNLLVESGELRFAQVTKEWGIDVPSQHRSRVFLPFAAPDGRAVDLYLVGQARQGFPNQLLRAGRSDGVSYRAEPASPLTLETGSEGLEAFADLDRDGDRDLLLVDHRRLRLFLGENGSFREAQSAVCAVPRVVSVAVGDLDRDGLPDVVVGSSAQATHSDHLSWRPTRLIVVATAQAGDAGDGVTFAAGGDLLVDLIFKEGLIADDPSTIAVGAEGWHPASRRFTVSAARAAGEPAREGKTGTFLWHAAGRWHLRWVAAAGAKGDQAVLRGSVEAASIAAVEAVGFEQVKPEKLGTDRLFVNRGGELQLWPGAPSLEHEGETGSLAIEDLDNDGWLDVVLLRRGEAGAENGEPVLLHNRAGSFEVVTRSELSTPVDDLGSADLVTAGDVDGDGRVDLLVTNGFGLKPENVGPLRLFRNVTEGAGHFLRLDLVGRRSNRDALGAQVEVWGKPAGAAQAMLLAYRELGAGFNRTQRSHTLHVGLGAVAGEVEVRVRWPAGASSTHRVAVDARHRLIEPGGEPGAKPTAEPAAR